MNIAAILAMLVQMHACAPSDFNGSDGSSLRVIVCPVMQHNAPAEAPDADPDKADPPGSDVPSPHEKGDSTERHS